MQPPSQLLPRVVSWIQQRYGQALACFQIRVLRHGGEQDLYDHSSLRRHYVKARSCLIDCGRMSAATFFIKINKSGPQLPNGMLCCTFQARIRTRKRSGGHIAADRYFGLWSELHCFRSRRLISYIQHLCYAALLRTNKRSGHCSKQAFALLSFRFGLLVVHS